MKNGQKIPVYQTWLPGAITALKWAFFLIIKRGKATRCLTYTRRDNATRLFKLKEKKSTQMQIKLPSNAFIADYIGISNRVVATSSAALQGLGVITEEDKTIVLEKMEIRRTRSANRSDLFKGRRCNQVTKNRRLFFNWRKDKKIVQEKEGSKLYKKLVQ